jgi:hypothetical protein
MYGWIWRRLPEALGLRLATALLLVLGTVALLMGLVFPWVGGIWPTDDPGFRLDF